MPLRRRFFWQVAVVSVGMLLLAGATEGWFGWREARLQVTRQQGLQAQAAAAEIEQVLQQLERSVLQVQALPWGQAGFGPQQRREELHRLLALNPAIVEVIDLDAAGREQLAVSRVVADRGPSAQPAPAEAPALPNGEPARQVAYGHALFDEASVPFVWLAVRGAGLPVDNRLPEPGRTLVRINLRFLGDVVSGLRVADGGEVYVIDQRRQVIAHPDPTLVLQRRRLAQDALPKPVQPAATPAGLQPAEAADGPGLRGQPAITTAVALKGPPWMLFVEHPRSQALAPVLSTLQRTALLLGLAVLAALLTSAAFARRMAAPVGQLRSATAAIAAGRRGERIELRTGDELQGLAADFNTMLDKLEQSYAELEAKVVERTREAREGREAAERANEARLRFLANASHDLRQPMQAIGLLVGLLREQVAQASAAGPAGTPAATLQPLQQRIQQLYGAVRGMDSMFNGLFDLSKLDVGAVKPQPQPFLAADLLRDRALLHATAAESKGLSFRTRLPRGGEPLVIDSDPAEVDRIVANLCTNAIRYTQRGGVLLAAQRRGNEVWLRVFDTGRGIAPQDQQRIFDEFVRLGSDRGAGPDEGLGLGLAIVRRTARLLGARVWLASRPGRGSCFTLALPAAATPWRAAAEPPPEVGDLAGAFAVVVDDNADNRSAMAALMTLWGMTVVTAADAAAALAACEEHLRTPDVIVTDLRLGAGDDGIALIRALRAQAGLPVPALLVTAEPTLPREPDGDVRLLHKPVADVTLRDALRQALAAGVQAPA